MTDKPSTTMRRMWINQPSTLQPLHRLHGVKVLACADTDRTSRAYFLSGDIIDMQVPRETLSEGWPEHASRGTDSDDAMIYGIHEEGPSGTSIGFVDLTRLDQDDPAHAAYRTAVLEAAGKRRRQGFGGAMLPHEDMLLLMGEVPDGAKIPDTAMPYMIHGFANLEAVDED